MIRAIDCVTWGAVCTVKAGGVTLSLRAVQAKQRNMEEMTPGQLAQMARNERAIEQAMVRSL